MTGGTDVQQTKTQKKIAQEIMRDVTFELHKWHSNQPQLEDSGHPEPNEDQSFAKQLLQVKPSESKLLGVKWNKIEDTISVHFPSESNPATKREVLAKLAKVLRPPWPSVPHYAARETNIL